MPRKLYVGPGLPRDLQVRQELKSRVLEGEASAPRHTPHCYPPLPRVRAQERELEDAFYKFGKLTNIWIARNPPGFAYVVSRRRRAGTTM